MRPLSRGNVKTVNMSKKSILAQAKDLETLLESLEENA